MTHNKYGAHKTVVDGITFASAKEARIYGNLKLLQRAKVICDLTLQPRFILTVNGQRICAYTGDYKFTEAGKTVVGEAKGYRTRDYVIRAKLFRALYPDIELREY